MSDAEILGSLKRADPTLYGYIMALIRALLRAAALKKN